MCRMNKRYKSGFAFALMFILFALSACGRNEERVSETTKSVELKAKSDEIVSLLSDMINSEYYMDAMVANDEMKDYVNSWRKTDYKHPDAIYEISYEDLTLDGVFATMDMSSDVKNDMSEELKKNVSRNMASSGIISVITAQYGTIPMAATSIISVKDVFTKPDMNGNAIYIYYYEDACPVIIDYVRYDDGAVSAYCTVIPDSSMKLDEEEGVKAFITKSRLAFVIGSYEITKVK